MRKTLLYGVLLSLIAVPAMAQDPFADIVVSPTESQTAQKQEDAFTDNLLIRKEVGAFLTYNPDEVSGKKDYARGFAGFELQKKFSNATSTVASVTVQGRLVYRHDRMNTLSDPMGMSADDTGWKYETHNAYADFYNVAGDVGAFNVRIGRYYVPFGLNVKTDTHATFMQLTNGRNFGFKQDWMVGAYGALNDNLDYDVGYYLGDGMDSSYKGQAGLLAGRIGLNNDWLFDRNLEGGLSGAVGQRVSKAAVMRSPSVAAEANRDNVVDTWRIGLDGRWKMPVYNGTVTFTGEGSIGQDEKDDLYTAQLQTGWLSASRQWGADVAYRHFWQDISGRDNLESTMVYSANYYLDNAITGSRQQWIGLGVEQPLDSQSSSRDTVFTLHYYRYW